MINDQLPEPRVFLQDCIRSFDPWYQMDGEMHDPIVDEPTQYGTAYHALGRLILGGEDLEKGLCGLEAAVRHVVTPDGAIGRASGVDRSKLKVISRLNHRDFFWPAVMKGLQIVKSMQDTLSVEQQQRCDAVETMIRRADVPHVFSQRPPSNWAAVWLSGEFARWHLGLSPYGLEELDVWLGVFFESHIDLAKGLYQEPGHSNSYDLFTRYHLADIVAGGYEGEHRQVMEELMMSGLQRSLAVQLSDGSLASAHRSTGQTWTLGCQVAYFTHAANFFENRSPDLAAQARSAAVRAYQSMTRWHRHRGEVQCYAPVENALPPHHRVGYEVYTADGHYSNLALGFLAVGLQNGFTCEDVADQPRQPSLLLECDPTWRAVAACGDYAASANAWPAPAYDGWGLVDLSFGPGRFFQLVSSVRCQDTQEKFWNPGLAIRTGDSHQPIAQMRLRPTTPWTAIDSDSTKRGFSILARPQGMVWQYELSVAVASDGISVSERTCGRKGPLSLILPYLFDAGTGRQTHLEIDRQPDQTVLRFEHGEEIVCCTIDAAIDQVVEETSEPIVPSPGTMSRLIHQKSRSPVYENRRGYAHLLRLDLSGPEREAVTYRWQVIR